MRRFLGVLPILVVIASLFPAQRGRAQTSDQEWLENCRRDGSGRHERHCEVRETRIATLGGALEVTGLRNGGISVTGWDRPDAVIRTRVQAYGHTMADARSLAAQVRTVVSGSEVRVEGPRSDHGQHWSASLVISAPRQLNLRAETRNGPVSVAQVRGSIDVQTRNGPLALRDLAGRVTARTTNGPLSVLLSGTRWDGSGLDARTTNGPLSIVVPENYSARLEAGTTNGPMSLGFPVTVQGRISRNINTQLGSGGALIRAYTTNGPLSLVRR